MSPEISDSEYKKFKELLEEEKKRSEGEKVSRELYLEKLTKYKDSLLDLNKSYGPMEAYSLAFSKWLTNFFEANDMSVSYFDWSDIQRYLTEVCLDLNKKGETRLKKSFREGLKDRGFKTLINRKYNVFKVEKCQPRKVG